MPYKSCKLHSQSRQIGMGAIELCSICASQRLRMKFCKKCGSIMMPKKDGDKVMFSCHCGYSERGESKIKEAVKQEKIEIGVVEKEIETKPVVKAKCPHCKNDEAYNWEIQTRAGDEAATQFFKCRKCSHTWREYK